MSWPFFADLGKNAKDILSKAYNCGTFNLDIKSKASPEVEVSSNIVTELDTYNASGAISTKYKTDCGIYLMKLDTENRFSAQVTFPEFFTKGLQVSVDCSFAPQEGSKSGHVKGAYATELCSLSADLNTDAGNPSLNLSGVLGCCCAVAGIQGLFDLSSKEMTGNSVAIGYLDEDLIVHASFSNGNELNGSVYQKVNSGLELGIQISSSTITNEADLGMGCKYKLSKEAVLYAKGNSRGQIAIGYQQLLHEGITMSVSTQGSVGEAGASDYKLGFALAVEL